MESTFADSKVLSCKIERHLYKYLKEILNNKKVTQKLTGEKMNKMTSKGKTAKEKLNK